jgi:hypothetical protein
MRRGPPRGLAALAKCPPLPGVRVNHRYDANVRSWGEGLATLVRVTHSRGCRSPTGTPSQRRSSAYRRGHATHSREPPLDARPVPPWAGAAALARPTTAAVRCFSDQGTGTGRRRQAPPLTCGNGSKAYVSAHNDARSITSTFDTYVTRTQCARSVLYASVRSVLYCVRSVLYCAH